MWKVKSLRIVLVAALLFAALVFGTQAFAENSISEYIITDESAEEILALADVPGLERIDGTASKEYDALLELYHALPDCDVFWNYEFEGKLYSSRDEKLKVRSADGLTDAVRYLPNLNYIDLIDSDASLSDLDACYEINPDAFYYWEFYFDGYVIRTDIKCYSTFHGAGEYRYKDEEMYPIFKYCKYLRALDVGHNDLKDMTYIGKLTDLEILILADNLVEDASPLANLKNLWYLEIFMCYYIENYDFLYELPKLTDINACYCEKLENLDFLGSMPDFKFGFFKFTGATQSMAIEWMEKIPDCDIVISDGDRESVSGNWRGTERNTRLRYCFGGWRHITDYRSYDDADFDFGRYVYPNCTKQMIAEHPEKYIKTGS